MNVESSNASPQCQSQAPDTVIVDYLGLGMECVFGSSEQPPNPKLAFQHFLRASVMGQTMGTVCVAKCLESGFGTPKCTFTAFLMYHDAAVRGDVEAAFHVARCYSQGIGVDADADAARTWTHIAADAGCPKHKLLLLETQTETAASHL